MSTDDGHTAENDAHPRLWERLLPVLNDAVGNGALTRDEAFAVLDSLGKPRAIPPAERDCNGYALGSSCGCKSAADCPASSVIPPGESEGAP